MWQLGSTVEQFEESALRPDAGHLAFVRGRAAQVVQWVDFVAHQRRGVGNDGRGEPLATQRVFDRAGADWRRGSRAKRDADVRAYSIFAKPQCGGDGDRG